MRQMWRIQMMRYWFDWRSYYYEKLRLSTDVQENKNVGETFMGISKICMRDGTSFNK